MPRKTKKINNNDEYDNNEIKKKKKCYNTYIYLIIYLRIFFMQNV